MIGQLVLFLHNQEKLQLKISRPLIFFLETEKDSIMSFLF